MSDRTVELTGVEASDYAAIRWPNLPRTVCEPCGGTLTVMDTNLGPMCLVCHTRPEPASAR